jgi:2-hydroxymethylglutarate dehydrogenase
VDIGFIGIGQMGRHMARHILEAGFNLTVYDLRKEAAKPLLEKGARWAGSPADVARASQVVITSLPGPGDIEQVVFGPDGLKSGWKNGDIYIDMSTNSPAVIQHIADEARHMGVSVLDAPVSGGTRGAEMATLTIMVGGEPAVLEKVRKVLESMGAKVALVGAVGCGNVAKLINNMIALTCSSVAAEGFVLGIKAGIDPQVLWDIVTSSTGDSWVVRQFPQSVFSGAFPPQYRLSLAHKDISLAVQMGRDYEVPLLVASVVEQKLIDADAAGLGDKHVDAVILRLEELTGIQVRTKKSPAP